jgi:CheY-like chemotaxis protein
MSAKRALVVDDSRSARAFLGRILERHNLEVDTAESAEQAIEYLVQQRPDVIFMDHLMPGMDGLQAVRAIKNDPRTATIPILMYTSQDGELYLGQARALGALGVLPKQTRPADVTKALVQLHLVGDQVAAPELSPNETDQALSTPTPAAAANAARPAMQLLAPELQRVVTALLDDHSSEMRRFVVEHLEAHADRIVGDLRAVLREEGAATAGNGAAGAAVDGDGNRVGQLPRLLPVLAVVVVLLAAGLLWLWYQAISTQETIAAELHTAQQQLTATRTALAELQSQSARTAAAVNAGAAVAGDSFVEPVPFGEQPLALGRVDKLQAQLEQLLAQNFKGRVQIQTFNGRYCLTGSGDAAALAEPELPQAKCDSLGQPASLSAASRESVSFANMIASLRARARGRISFSVEAGSPAELAVNYPAANDKLTAGEWNQAAAKNNRVEMHWYAEP